MFCEKCGAQIPEGGKFCEKCGASVDGSVPAAAPAPAPAAPSPAVLAIKKFFSNKRNVLITAIALAVIVIVIIVAAVVSSQPKKVVLDDYFDIVYTGCDGYASAHIEWDTEALAKIDNKIFRDNKKKQNNSNDILGGLENITDQYASLQYYVNLALSYEPQYLSNGDTVTVSYTVLSEDFEEKYNVKLKLKHETVEVKDLAPVVAVNPMDNVTVSFSGFNGYGNLTVTVPETAVAVGNNGYTMNYTARDDGFNAQLVSAEGYNRHTLYYRFDKSSVLTNGESVVCTISAEDNLNNELASIAGISVSTESKTYSVSGLTELVSFDPFTHLVTTFSGYNSIGEMAIDVSSAEVNVGNYLLKLSTESTNSRRRFYIAICDASGSELQSIYYTNTKFSDLSNGDTVEFTTSTNLESLERNYGITFPETKSVSVAGLELPTEAKPFDNMSVTFSGYEGYGILSMTPIQDVYTVGAYTFKLTPTVVTEGWSKACTLTIVIADKDGNNLFTVEYRGDNYYNISANGTETTFTCRASDSKREEYLRNYGIFFEETVVYTVSGLTPTTAVDPREMLTYSFSGENGSIVMSLALKQSSYTVGNYTIQLRLAEESSWGSVYLREYFDVVDAAGNIVASGYYQASSWQNLSEGGTIRMNENVDQSAIAIATGLIFSEEKNEVIVSTK